MKQGLPVSWSDLIPVSGLGFVVFLNGSFVHKSLELTGKYHPEYYEALTN